MLYKDIIQVENKNVGLKVGGGGGGEAQKYHCPQYVGQTQNQLRSMIFGMKLTPQ